MSDVEKLRTVGRSYAIVDEITNGSTWFSVLYKRNFQIAVTSGWLSEVKLRCDRRYVGFAFDPAMKYRIGDQYGTCYVELVGDPGTKFKLTQS